MDSHAALPLAVLMLSESRDGTGERLDGGNLSALDGGPWFMIVSPVHWYQAPSSLKLMIDRLVCADGGNPDPTLISGKDPQKAKEVELQGWSYPRHLSGRLFARDGNPQGRRNRAAGEVGRG